MSHDKSWQDALRQAGIPQASQPRLRSRQARKTRDRFLAVTLVTGSWLISAWALMIPVGIAHRDWWHLLPPMSFGTAAALTFWPFAIGAAVTLARAYLGMD